MDLSFSPRVEMLSTSEGAHIRQEMGQMTLFPWSFRNVYFPTRSSPDRRVSQQSRKAETAMISFIRVSDISETLSRGSAMSRSAAGCKQKEGTR